MDDLLTEYLTDACTVERKALLLDACSVLESLGINDHYDYIDFALSNAQDGMSMETINEIENILYTKYVEAVNSYSIELVDDVSLEVMCHLCWGLSVIENWADPQMIFEALEAAATPIDALSDVLGLICEEGSEEWFTYIVKVNPNLIDRIRETIAPAFESIDVTDHEAELAAAKIERFNRYFKSPNIPVVSTTLLHLKWRVGRSVDTLPPDTLQEISKLQTNDCAAAILAFTLLSEAGDDEIDTTVTRLLDLVFDNVNQQEAILTSIRNQMKVSS